jgi:ribonuclease HI
MYLGVPIFRGKPKAVYFQPIVDKVKLKLASWKASLLTYAGRIQLVKSVIQSMLIYSITTYSWPVSLIKELERYMRNFIWSGDLLVKKVVTVSWNKVCSPVDEGGLGIRSLSNLNKASNLKLFWELIISNNQWASVLRSRVIRGNGFINYHIYSSIWSGIKSQAQIISQNTRWLLGNGKSINFWLHNWSGISIVNYLHIPQQLHSQLRATVSDFIINHQWFVPLDLQAAYPTLLPYLNQFTIPLEDKEDKLLWIHNSHGDLTLKDAYSFFTTVGQKVNWAKSVWNIAIPPSKSFMVWRLFHHKMPTDEILSIRGLQLPSVCSLCNKEAETTNHLFLHCPFSLALWNWLSSIINQMIDSSTISALWRITNGSWNPQCKIVVTATVIYIFNSIWTSRNNLRFKNIKPNINSIISLIIANVSLVGNYTSLAAGPSINDFEIMKFFKVGIHQPRPPKIIEVLWTPPLHGWYKCNTDGSSLGNPRLAACAGVFRNHKGEFIGGFAQKLGRDNALFAEIMGVILAIECASEKNWNQLWVECDSRLVVSAFKNPNIIPWHLQNRWLNCITKIKSMNFCISHIYREGNHCADKLASLGLTLNDYTWWNIAPLIIRKDLVSNRLGLPFFRVC